MRETNPLHALAGLGQSVWLDFIRRDLLRDGSLERLIREDGVSGMTSNPAIFEKAIVGSTEYDAQIADLVGARLSEPKALYEELAIADIQGAADLLAPVHRVTHGRDGFVSLEVSPELADDTEGTLAEARRLFRRVHRANLMIKVPGTPAGFPAIRRLIREGIPVNVTLLFSRAAYEQAAEAYCEGLEERLAAGEPIDQVASVASFFVSRIDTAIDAELDRLATAQPLAAPRLAALAGKIAIANAKLAYATFRRQEASARWRWLAESHGARPQRLLWASTSTKNPAYRDVVYVEELIGAETVNTMPPETLEAFRRHGRPRPSLGEDLEAASIQLAELAAIGVSLDAATERLLAEGITKFVEPYRKLLDAVERRGREIARRAGA